MDGRAENSGLFVYCLAIYLVVITSTLSLRHLSLKERQKQKNQEMARLDYMLSS